MVLRKLYIQTSVKYLSNKDGHLASSLPFVPHIRRALWVLEGDIEVT